jgi:hypothetical protein
VGPWREEEGPWICEEDGVSGSDGVSDSEGVTLEDVE